jgi:ADP-ribosyl-[dinitrogen reductase] hydrolase
MPFGKVVSTGDGVRRVCLCTSAPTDMLSHMLSSSPAPSPLLSRAYAGVLGALVGNALGVPHEYKSAQEIPPESQLNLVLPAAYPQTHPGVPCGCWSGDGSGLLCLLQTLRDHQGELDLTAFAGQLRAWRDTAWHQAGGRIFDRGSAAGTVLDRVRAGAPACMEGEDHNRGQGNGSLTRALPAALLPAIWRQDPGRAIAVAMKQSRVTHQHPLAQVCCAVYAQLALRWLSEPELPVAAAIDQAFETVGLHPMIAAPGMRSALQTVERFRTRELPTGSGFVVDSLWTALWALERGKDYLSAVRLAISLGNDTDGSACVCGGLAGIRHGMGSVPPGWWKQIRVPVESRRLLDFLFNQRQQRIPPPSASSATRPG